MAFTDSADTSDQDIDKYLMSKKPAAETSPGLISQDNKPPAPQKQPVDIDKILSTMPKMPAMPKLQNIPAAPPQQYDSPYKAMSGPLMFFATLASLMTRHPAQTAMNSFSAMINANVKGQKQQMDEARENWKESMDVVLQQNQVELERYHLIQEKYKDDVNTQLAHIMAMSSAFNDPVAQAAFRLGPEMGFKVLEDRQTQADKLRAALEKQREDDETERHHRAEEQEQSLGKTPQAVALHRFIDEHADDNDGKGASAEQISQFIQGQHPPRSAPAMFMSKFMEEHAEDHGGKGPTSNEVSKAYGDFVGNTQYQRSAGSYASRVEAASNEFAQVAPLALESSAQLPRGNWVPLNKLIQNYQAGTSDPKYFRFTANTVAALTAYTKAMNPTGSPRVADRIEVKEKQLLDQAVSIPAYKAMMSQMGREIRASKQAIADTRNGDNAVLEQKIQDIIDGKIGDETNPDLGETDKAGWATTTTGVRYKVNP